MTLAATARQRLFLVIGVLSISLGVATGRAELVALGTPMLVLVGVGALAEQPVIAWTQGAMGRSRALEGEQVTLHVTVSVTRPVRNLELLIGTPEGLLVEDAVMEGEQLALDDGVIVASLPIGESTISVTLRCLHWGTYQLLRVEVRRRGFTGTLMQVAPIADRLDLKVFPEVAVLRRLLEPVETQLGFGDLVSRKRGTGFEYADLRPLVHGDDPRKINWRVTARASEPWITERHPERNADVVIMLDTFADARRGVDQTLDLAVSAVAALVEAHGRRLDRVGLIAFGEPVRWLQPGMGDRHRYRVLDMLMESHLVRQQYWRGLEAVPPHSLPPNSLVIGLTPLLDERAVRAFADVRSRGFDLAVVELEVDHFLPPARHAGDALARRIWALERAHIRRRFAQHGVVVVPWKKADPFPAAVLRADAFRRRLQRARA
ncbi:MAG: DUF58 domain-containing protein [Acidimicrobiia bacterium]|nr:DUF58 domain-containing protein [Acidimicrobiia bacterium]